MLTAQQLEDHAPFLGLRLRIEVRRPPRALVFDAFVNQQGGVAAVVQDQGGPRLSRPRESLLGAPPVLFDRLAFPCEDGRPLGRVRRPSRADDHGRRGVILRREDVAGGPTHFCAEFHERLDEDRSLHGHVERARDPRAVERPNSRVFLAQGHEARHLVLRQADLVASSFGQRQIGDAKGRAVASGLLRRGGFGASRLRGRSLLGIRGRGPGERGQRGRHLASSFGENRRWSVFKKITPARRPAPLHRSGTYPTIRSGPPLPPSIFMGRATAAAPVAGSWSRLATFSKPATFCAYRITCDSKLADWP